MLLSRISQPPPSSPTPEDIFSSALTTIFTDDTVNSHGTPGSYVTYRSPRFGDLKLFIPAHPDEEEGRKLFAHYLWNAAVVAADGIESASAKVDELGEHVGGDIRDQERMVKWDQRHWDLRGKSVLELGAGTALPSLIAASSGARSCTITDHPSSPALTTGATEKNVEVNLLRLESASTCRQDEDISVSSKAQAASAPQTSRETCSVQVLGYTWGTSTFYLPNRYGKPAPPHTTPSCFDRIIVADCLWMPSQHINLIKTILQFLPLSSTKADGPQAGPEEDQHKSQTTDFPCALVIAGFHTGRRIVSDFFSLATESQPSPQREESQTPNMGNDAKYKLPDPATANTISIDPSTLTPSERSACGILRLASIFEVDVEGNVRAWEKERVGEGKWDAKRWCVVGVLIRP